MSNLGIISLIGGGEGANKDEEKIVEEEEEQERQRKKQEDGGREKYKIGLEEVKLLEDDDISKSSRIFGFENILDVSFN